MKKLTALFLSVIILAAVGCSKPIDENEQNDPSGNTENDPGIQQETPEPPAPQTVEGMVVAITKNEATSSVPETGMVTVLLDSGAKTVFPLSESFSEPSLGDRVKLTLDGQTSVSDLQVTKPFNAETLPAAVYSVKNVDAGPGTTEKFKVFSDYDECRKFLQDNSLDAEFDRMLGETDITSLTDTFFASNDLCVFISDDFREAATPTLSSVDSGEELSDVLSSPYGKPEDSYGGLFDGLESEAVNGQVFADGRTLYLRVTQVSSAADTDGGSTVYLVPVQKGSVSDGILLLEKVLGNGMNIEENDSGTENGEPTEEMPEKETPEKNEPSSKTDENDSESDA